MNMVRHSSDLDEGASLFPDDAAHVVVETIAVFRSNERHPALRAENDVEDEHHIAMRHFAPFSQEISTLNSTDPKVEGGYHLQKLSRRDKGGQPRISILGDDGSVPRMRSGDGVDRRVRCAETVVRVRASGALVVGRPCGSGRVVSGRGICDSEDRGARASRTQD